MLVLHSLPLEFPLAMAFAEQLLTWRLSESSEQSEDDLDTLPSSVLLQVVELLGESVFPCCCCWVEEPRSQQQLSLNHRKCCRSYIVSLHQTPGLQCGSHLSFTLYLTRPGVEQGILGRLGGLND